MCNIRNSTEDHSGRREKLNGKSSEREKNHETLDYRKQTGVCWRRGEVCGWMGKLGDGH